MVVGGSNGCYAHGRAIEGLKCFYDATREQAALDEAARLAEYHFQHTLCHDGALSDGCGGRTHSYLNTLRGLLLFAVMNGQQDHLDVLSATCHDAVAAMITPSGFITHDIDGGPGGDIASAGDIAHIALMLWERFRNPALLDDAERIVRCRLLPAQVLEPMPVRPQREDTGDSFRDLPQRFVGAICGSVGQVQGQTCVTDFTAAALHSLIEVYQSAVCIEADAVRVKFHLDCELTGVRVESQRGRKEARVEVWNDTGKDLLIRVPGWAPVPSVRVEVNDKSVSPNITKGFARVNANGAQQMRATLLFELPHTQTEEPWKDSDAKQKTLTFHWGGTKSPASIHAATTLSHLPSIAFLFRTDDENAKDIQA